MPQFLETVNDLILKFVQFEWNTEFCVNAWFQDFPHSRGSQRSCRHWNQGLLHELISWAHFLYKLLTCCPPGGKEAKLYLDHILVTALLRYSAITSNSPIENVQLSGFYPQGCATLTPQLIFLKNIFIIPQRTPYPLSSSILLSSPAALGHCTNLTFCLYTPLCTWLLWAFHVNGIIHSIYPYVSGFFCSRCFQGASMLGMSLLILTYCQVIFYCVNLLHFIYPFISWRTFELFLLSGYCK